jgi:hypothetical protein
MLDSHTRVVGRPTGSILSYEVLDVLLPLARPAEVIASLETPYRSPWQLFSSRGWPHVHFFD